MAFSKYALIFIHLSCASVLFFAACSSPAKGKLQGDWKGKSGADQLKITDKKFTLDSDDAEDYFRKGDTIFTSFEGNMPYSKFVVQKLDEHNLTLLSPDSTVMEFNR